MNNQQILEACMELAKSEKIKEERQMREESIRMLKWCFGERLSFTNCVSSIEYKIQGTEYFLRYNGDGYLKGYFTLFLIDPHMSFNSIKITNWATLGTALLEAEKSKIEYAKGP